MSSMMKNWIAPAVLDEFSSALATLKSQYTAGETLQKYPYDCSPTAVSVHLKRPGRVQLIEYNGRSHDAFDVTLSDGTTKIRAAFTVECAAEFGGIRDAVQSTIGGVLGISECYLTYKPNSSPSESLTFRVTKFQKLGSVGERTFGAPTEIEKQESIWDVLTQLDSIISGSETNDEHVLDDALDIQSQAGDITDGERSPIASITTQTAFATQVVAREIGIDFNAAVRVPQGPDLLSLLNLPRQTAAISGSRAGLSSATTRKTTANAIKILQPVPETRKAQISSRLDAKANSQSSVPSNDSKEVALPSEDLELLTVSAFMPDDSEKENSQETQKERSSKPTPVNRPVEDAAQRDVSDFFMARTSYETLFEGMKRVPRRYVQIPRNQQALLASADSWWQPENSSRASYANLPPEVTHELISFTERNPHGGRTHDNERPECSATGSDQGEEEEVSEDDAQIVETAEQDDSQPEEFEELDNDSESAISWAESYYDDLGPSRPQAAAGPPSENISSDVVDLAEIDAPSTTPDPPTGQTANPPSPSYIKRHTSSRLRPRNFDFPSSSPGDEEELEMAVPYAIDDVLDEEDDGIGQEQETSQELPSTASGHQPVIQVEQTPDHNVPREARALRSAEQHDPKRQKRTFENARNMDGHVSSDPIPATFNDSSQECLSCAERGQPTTSDRHSGLIIYTAEEQRSGSQEEDHADEAIEEDKTPEEQLFTELRSSQLARHGAGHSSLVSTPGRSLRSPIQAITRRNSSQIVSPLSRLPQQLTSYSPHTALSETRSDAERLSSEQSDHLQQRGHVELELDVAEFIPPKIHKSLNIEASQTQPDFKNTEDLVRAARRTFHQNNSMLAAESPSSQFASSPPLSPTKESEFRDTNYLAKAGYQDLHQSYSSPTEDPPVVQIVQSQPISPEIGQASSVRPSDNPICSQGESLVYSSILDRQGETVLGTHKLEGTLAADSSEPSIPAILTSPLSPTNFKAEVGISGPLDELILTRSSQSSRRMGIQQEKIIDILSLSSDSDDENLGDGGEQVQVLATITPNERSADSQEMADTRDLTHKEDIANSIVDQQRRSCPPKTDFDNFKSIYPSYKGKEKNFVWALVYIEWLVETKGTYFLRASLWDDFIRFLAEEYLEHIQAARRTRDKMMTGFEHFNMMDKPPMFQQQVMTPKTLKRFLSTLDPAQLDKIRLLFSKVTPPADLSKSHLSHGSSSIASDNPQSDQTRKNGTRRVSIHTTEFSEPGTAPESEPRPSQRFERVFAKRPFFETPSQLQPTKKPRLLRTPKNHEGDFVIPHTSTGRRSLPWHQSDEKSAPTTLDRPSMTAPTFSSRIRTTSVTFDTKQKSTTSNSPNDVPISPFLGDDKRRSRKFDIGHTPSRSNQRSTTSGDIDSLGSPILGKTTPKTRSLNINDIRVGSIGASALFKKPSAPVSKAALLQHSGLVESKADKVEGWLDDTKPESSRASTPSVAPRNILPRNDSIKRKRNSGLELLKMQPSGSPATTRPALQPVTRPIASSSSSRVSNTSIGTSALKKPPSYREFLAKKRRESGQMSKPSTPDSKATSVSGSGKRVERRSVEHAEPETQAWGV
ncbi:hypothetical protein D0Z07_8498 [Hyphodiscus hymeniophilus]|uniref:Shelterin complex subunit TPP1/Est3 domain-containing protein n=1 Tax=Hyphodiscus hymeniophilus TaxID=353542 RepID=A0A9P6SK59_9HELO|nr:hypothetical protein D0Z07_8498 [Hyphodiscus hymeniophilus]